MTSSLSAIFRYMAMFHDGAQNKYKEPGKAFIQFPMKENSRIDRITIKLKPTQFFVHLEVMLEAQRHQVLDVLTRGR
ncbi:hypothetical protein ACFLZM_07270 [Thermodesulfobacteriota bacterium]